MCIPYTYIMFEQVQVLTTKKVSQFHSGLWDWHVISVLQGAFFIQLPEGPVLQSIQLKLLADDNKIKMSPVAWQIIRYMKFFSSQHDKYVEIQSESNTFIS